MKLRLIQAVGLQAGSTKHPAFLKLAEQHVSSKGMERRVALVLYHLVLFDARVRKSSSLMRTLCIEPSEPWPWPPRPPLTHPILLLLGSSLAACPACLAACPACRAPAHARIHPTLPPHGPASLRNPLTCPRPLGRLHTFYTCCFLPELINLITAV